MKLHTSRLFWKLFIAFWLAMMLTFLCGLLYMELMGYQTLVNSNRPTPLMPMVSAAFAGLLFSIGLAWYLSKPLRHLRWALRRVADGQFDTRVKPLMGSRQDEIVDLAGDFDSMAARLQLLTEQRTQLFHDVSHELRSPLARMQAAIGLLRKNPASLDPMIERIESEVARIDVLIEELLTLHRLEAGSAGPRREPLDLIELMTTIAHDASFEASARRCSVVFHAKGIFVANVDSELIFRAFENVVRNAVKYTATGTEVHIDTKIIESESGDSLGERILELSVRDHGQGVPLEHCEDIFEPFWRMGYETRESVSESVELPLRGVGLGLAIARRAMAFHSGYIYAVPADGGGLRVVIGLPQS
jgi:signal transduction histidine kinase